MKLFDRRSTPRNDKPERRDWPSREAWLAERIAEVRAECERLDTIERDNAAKRASYLEGVAL
jgi:hypothetical protein